MSMSHNFSKHIIFSGIIVSLVTLVAALFVPNFFLPQNLINIFFTASILFPAVAGMQALLILGKFDLSVGALASMLGMIAGLILVGTQSIALALLGVLIVAAIAGFIYGYLVSTLKVSALLVTLAGTGIAGSIALGVGGGRIITGFPDTFAFFGQATFFSIPMPIAISLILLIIIEFLFKKVSFFRHFYAAGSNAIGATYAGIRAHLLVYSGFMLLAVGAGLTIVMQISRSMSASPLLFSTLPLEAIAAGIIGGAQLRGGRGTFVGAFIGVLVIVAVQNITVLLGVPIFWKELVIGVLLLMVLMYRMLLSKYAEV